MSCVHEVVLVDYILSDVIAGLQAEVLFEACADLECTHHNLLVDVYFGVVLALHVSIRTQCTLMLKGQLSRLYECFVGLAEVFLHLERDVFDLAIGRRILTHHRRLYFALDARAVGLLLLERVDCQSYGLLLVHG